MENNSCQFDPTCRETRKHVHLNGLVHLSPESHEELYAQAIQFTKDIATKATDEICLCEWKQVGAAKVMGNTNEECPVHSREGFLAAFVRFLMGQQGWTIAYEPPVIRKTPDEWLAIEAENTPFVIVVADPDGWSDLGELAWETPITQADFHERLGRSTVTMTPKPKDHRDGPQI